LAARLPAVGALATGACFAGLSFAGVVFLRRLTLVPDSSVSLLIFGSIFGLACGRLCLILTGLYFGPSLIAASAALGIVLAAALLGAMLGSPVRFPWNDEDQSELNCVLVLNAAILLAMALPYWAFGHLTSRGYAFIPHFNWDLFNHITHTAELARSLPPQNSYFAGRTLHYYWFFYLWPAALVDLAGTTARDSLILTLPSVAFLFVGALNCLVRRYTPGLAPRLLAIGLALFAFSYIGVFYFVRLLLVSIINNLSYYVNTNYSYLSHSWYRDFLYEPCSMGALTYLLFLVYVDATPGYRPGWRSSLLSGLLLGFISITDLFIGMIAFLWFAASKGTAFLRSGRDRVEVMGSMLVSASIVLGGLALQLFPSRSGGTYGVRPEIHPIAKYGPIYLLVELGPLFVFGIAGLFLCMRRSRFKPYLPMSFLLVLALILGFTLVVPYEPNLVIRKAIKVVQVPMVVFAAVACGRYLELPTFHRVRLLGLPVILAGTLSPCSDILLYTDFDAKRVDKTTYVSPSKMRVLEWLRDCTNSDTVVQILDEVRPGRGLELDNFDIDISINALGERRTLFGNYKKPYENHVPNSVIEERRGILEGVFRSRTPDELRQNLDRLPAHLLLVDWNSPGPLDAVRRLRDSGYLKEVCTVGEVSVFRRTTATD
jgi:hypothetical protein